ncbi:unnamed protein product [Nezara viridula]|uniref:Uncharacterized protein n=1 Tax=Nezara viridula TaxID=85310 RepID=A0A9P0HMD2_NEZVI|nr:unnamed protein product [Nezara viridula]
MKLIKWKNMGEKGLVARPAITKRSKLEVKGAPKDWDESTLDRVMWEKLDQGGLKRSGQERSREWVRPCFSTADRCDLKKWVIEVHPTAREIVRGEKIKGGWWTLDVCDYPR